MIKKHRDAARSKKDSHAIADDQRVREIYFETSAPAQLDRENLKWLLVLQSSENMVKVFGSHGYLQWTVQLHVTAHHLITANAKRQAGFTARATPCRASTPRSAPAAAAAGRRCPGRAHKDDRATGGTARSCRDKPR